MTELEKFKEWVKEAPENIRWTIICREDEANCPDTYGYGQEYINIVIEHMKKTGHDIWIQASLSVDN